MDRDVIEKKLESLRRCVKRTREAINWHIVHSIAKNHLVDFSEFARAIATKYT